MTRLSEGMQTLVAAALFVLLWLGLSWFLSETDLGRAVDSQLVMGRNTAEIEREAEREDAENGKPQEWGINGK